MVYRGSQIGYEATQAELDALPSWHEAGSWPELGMYRTISCGTHEPALVQVRTSPISGKPEQAFFRVKIVQPVRDAILTANDEEFHFQQY